MKNNNFRNFTSGIARTPPLSMADGITTQNESVDIQLARRQHQEYLNALEKLGISISLLPPEESLPDSHFVEDTAIIYHDTAILTQPGARERQKEVEFLRKYLPQQLPIVELSTNSEATLDGGDVLMTDDQVFIGLSHRTNQIGAQALSDALKQINPKLNVHFIEFSGVLHLKSGLIALNNEVFLGNPHLKFKEPFPFAKIVWLPENEGYAANTLVANNAALVFSECKYTQDILNRTHLKPIPIDLSEFRKMDGSFTCLSLLFEGAR